MEKLLLVVIDSLTDRLLRPLMDEGHLPNFQAVRERGQLRTSTSIFPSITHACLTSIATGKYPCDHQVLGTHWYLPANGEEAYYGADPDVIFNKGITDFFEDFLVELNNRRVKASTIFQTVESAGLEAASLNFMIYKGDVKHEVNLPSLLKLIPGIDDDGLSINGPSTLYLGQIVKASSSALPSLEVEEGMLQWFGLGDNSTINLLRQLAQQRSFPNFTLAYFPRNDYLSHSQGPLKAHRQLDELDAGLGEIFEAYGGIDKFLGDVGLLITGDHSQSEIKADDDAAISLEKLLEEQFSIAVSGEEWDSEYEIMAAPNLRAAQLYFKDPSHANLQKAIHLLRADSRIDQIMWRSDELNGREGYVVANGNARIRFMRGRRASDQHGNGWDWEGDLRAVDGQINDGLLTFPQYPNAFERIAGILDSEASGQLWMSASLGYEFEMPVIGIHAGGGSHGSLHAQDSLSPLLLAGEYDDYQLPDNPRLTDITPICLSLLEIG